MICMNPNSQEAVPSRVMTPDPVLRRPMVLLQSMWKDLMNSHGLAHRLFLRDVKGRFRNSLLGYLWLFLPPLATTLAFVFLNKQQVIRMEGLPVAYPAYAMLGTLLWQNFADALQAPLQMASQNRSMLVRVQFPREALILSGIYQVLFNFAVRLVLLVPVIVYFKVPVSSSILWSPVGVLALILLGTALGVLLTPLGILYKDVEVGMAMVLGFWMLLTPVVYPPLQSGLGAELAKWNPVSPLVQTSRDWLLGQATTTMAPFCWVMGGTLLLLFAGWVLYRVSIPHVIARIGN